MIFVEVLWIDQNKKKIENEFCGDFILLILLIILAHPARFERATFAFGGQFLTGDPVCEDLLWVDKPI